MDWTEIMILERPANVSWEEICSVLRKAHAENVSKGIILPYPQMSPEELYAKTEGRGAKMFVAMCKGKVVGTGACAVIKKNLWCGKGEYAYCFLDAVLPEYAGQGVYRRIVERQESYAKEINVERMMFDTHEQNRRMIDISKRNGYRPVEYRVRDAHNSVVLVKWLNGCPFSWIKCLIKYNRIRHMRKRKSVK